MAGFAPPMPPEVAAQENPQQAQSVFMSQGLMQPQPGMQAVQMVNAKLQELDVWLQDVLGILRQLHPPLVAHLAPIAQAGKTLKQSLGELAQRSGMAQGSPVMPNAPQTNPAAGPPNPMAF